MSQHPVHKHVSEKKHKFTTNMTFLENQMSWMIFHPSRLLTYLLYRFLEPPENQLAETTNIPKKGGMFFFPLMLNFRGVYVYKRTVFTSKKLQKPETPQLCGQRRANNCNGQHQNRLGGRSPMQLTIHAQTGWNLNLNLTISRQ